jgi:hypothetical protein
MGIVINRTTNELLRSVNTPDYPSTDWIQNPDLSSVLNVPKHYWKLVGDSVIEMTQVEKDTVDAAIAAQALVGPRKHRQYLRKSTLDALLTKHKKVSLDKVPLADMAAILWLLSEEDSEGSFDLSSL